MFTNICLLLSFVNAWTGNLWVVFTMFVFFISPHLVAFCFNAVALEECNFQNYCFNCVPSQQLTLWGLFKCSYTTIPQ